jgi:DNA helicase II / ATP-dependent DNA helicase PcrA
MEFIADFHVHSKYSRATAKNLDLENLYAAAQIKGITVIGTGDFTHPAWWQEIQDKLEPAEEGLFKLKTALARRCDRQVPKACRRPVRFMLVTEISNIYKKEELTRKNHNLVFMPDARSAERFNRRLDAIGNIQSDGRPILGLDARDLLEIVLETDDRGFLIPAHIWTPWFSLLGSKSGFNAVEECFGDLTPHIFALETGLSSDPPMNWRVSGLDRYTLVSNSDAHSPAKLGREANRFATDLSYDAIRKALKSADPDRFLGTIEFFPEEGKYHVDGHRKCAFRCRPDQTLDLEGLCPVCGKPLTLGVLYRVEELADRGPDARPPKAAAYRNLIPLEDVLSETLQVGPKSQKVARSYEQLITTFGSEFDILCNVPPEALARCQIPLLDEAVIRMRRGDVIFDPGYDGEFGRVRLFDPHERQSLQGQQCLFDPPGENPSPPDNCRSPMQPASEMRTPDPTVEKLSADHAAPVPALEPASSDPQSFALNAEQQSAVDHRDGPLLISAGPGTGKTRTITCRMAALLEMGGIGAENILAVTFTNKAAGEMRHRLREMLGPGATMPLVATFHGLGWRLLQEIYDGQAGAIVDEVGRNLILEDALEMAIPDRHKSGDWSTDKALDRIIQAKQLLLGPDGDLTGIADGVDKSVLAAVYSAYQKLLDLQELYDFEDLLLRPTLIVEQDKALRRRLRRQFQHIFVDEFQDINYAQYRLLRALAPAGADLCVIGDPDQAIYGFRGSDVRYFRQFTDDYPNVRRIRLTRNYRSTETILASAFQVIQEASRNLEQRDQARVYSDIQGIRTLTILEAASERAEAVAIGQTIEQMVGGLGFHSMDFDKLKGGTTDAERSFNDVAVLCRTGDQAGRISRQLIEAGIPCQLVHRSILRQPAVIKLLAALRVVTRQATYADLTHLIGICNPGISKETLTIFKQWAFARQLPLATALHTAHRFPIPGMSLARQQRLTAVLRLLERIAEECSTMSIAETLSSIARQTTLVSQVRQDDLDRLLELAGPFGRDMAAFGGSLVLQKDTDLYRPDVQKVAVMTLHAAKGLEFPVVFIAGCEDDVLPMRLPGDAVVDLDEERRLFYVGLTRAREELFLTWSRKRTLYGQTRQQHLSPFVAAIEDRLKSHLSPTSKPSKPSQEQLSLF